MAGVFSKIRGLRGPQLPSLHLRLTHKIAAIGIAGILGIGLIGAIYLVGASSQESFSATARDAQAMYARASRLFTLLQESRRAEKDFLLTNETQYADQQGQLSRTIEAELETLRKETHALGHVQLANAAEFAADGYRTYALQFAAVVETRKRLGLNENSGLEGEMRKSVHAIETRLKDFEEPQLTILMLMMRRHEKDFMLRRDPRYGDEFAKRTNEFSKVVAAMPLMSGADKAEIGSKLSDYERNFNAWLEATNGLGRDQRSSSKSYAAIEPTIDAMIKRVETVYNDLSAANERSRAETSLRMQI